MPRSSVDAAVRKGAPRWRNTMKSFMRLKKRSRPSVGERSKLREILQPGGPRLALALHQTEVATRIQKEVDAGVTRRSQDELAYTLSANSPE